MNYRYFFILLLLAVFYSCERPSKKDKAKLYYMEQEFNDYCLFPVYSYWVYEDSASGALDSVSIYYQNITINDQLTVVSWKYEQFQQHLFSSYNSPFIYEAGGADLMGLPENYCTYTDGIADLYFGDANVGDTLFLNRNLYYEAYYSTLILNSKEYKRVKAFQNKNQIHNRQVRKVYFSRGVGIIRKEMFDGKVWNLKRHFIAY